MRIENQNRKVRAAHNALVTVGKKFQDLSAAGSTNGLMKASSALEKSTVAFERVVDGAISLAGTGSGKVPLLLPPNYVRDHVDDRE